MRICAHTHTHAHAHRHNTFTISHKKSIVFTSRHYLFPQQDHCTILSSMSVKPPRGRGLWQVQIPLPFHSESWITDTHPMVIVVAHHIFPCIFWHVYVGNELGLFMRIWCGRAQETWGMSPCWMRVFLWSSGTVENKGLWS